MATLLGKESSYLFYSLLLLLPYVMLITMAIVNSFYFLLPLITLPEALRLKKDCNEGRLETIPQRTAQMNLVFGVLFVLSCLAA